MSNDRKVLSLRKDTSHLPAISERLHKVLANAGLGSRRSLEERIAAGEVRINGEIAQLGASINNGDRIEIDSRRFAAVPCAPEEDRVLMFHKPEGLVTTTDDPEGRPTVFEKLPRLKGARWVSVGRLDINTTGLLLLTTDGELANALMHPSHEVEREYVCRVFGEVTDAHLAQLTKGVELDDGPASFDEIHEIHRDEKHAWFRVTLREGRNREVRRLWEALGFMVSRLKRIRYGTVELPRELRRGHHRALTTEQVQALRKNAGLSDVPQSLTLEPIIGQRRAPVRPSNEFRPEPKQQRAWTGTSYDEARELRAFDRPLMDDALGRRKKRGPGGAVKKARGGKQPGRAGAGTGAARSGEPRTRGPSRPRPERGNAAAPSGARADAGQRRPAPRKPRKPKVMTGPMDSNEMLFRTWYPDDNAGNRRGNHQGNDDNRGNLDDNRGNRDDNRGNRAPPRDDGNRAVVDGNRMPSRDNPRRDNPGPGNRKRPPRNRQANEGGGEQRPATTTTNTAAGDNASRKPRQRRGPFRRVRKSAGEDGNGGAGPESGKE